MKCIVYIRLDSKYQSDFRLFSLSFEFGRFLPDIVVVWVMCSISVDLVRMMTAQTMARQTSKRALKAWTVADDYALTTLCSIDALSL